MEKDRTGPQICKAKLVRVPGLSCQLQLHLQETVQGESERHKAVSFFSSTDLSSRTICYHLNSFKR